MDEIRTHLEKLKASIERTRPDLLPDLDLLIKKWEEKTKEDQRVSAWHRVELARHIQRPTTLDYIQRIFDSFMELHGDRGCGDDPAIVGGIALFEGFPVTVIGHQKGRNMKENLMRNYGMAHPEGYRKALRLAKQAEKFSRPVITFIDTSGAYPGMTAEERGIGEAIARNLKEFSVLEVPVVCVVIGEGGSGGALGIGVGDEIYMLENAIYSVISPEGCASILLRDASKAKEAAELMKLTAQDLLAFGIIDGIVPEPPGGAHTDPDRTAGEIKKTLKDALKRLRQKKPAQLVKERSQKYFSIGVFEEGGEEGSSLLRRLFGQQTGA
ncbi:acetyl-CoA carboxylase carboxyltransferase subunit alpha [Spirochaeta thermophila]|uniref:Acetyl-coenzyme A carboxylase carboxyl transferase subunit alpha n=1 Tax=Winmispira thermophila (strain ATCC 49972 / DSM 6192 / RI 19.B1) TaxID=665571 RepID=E0RS21_WINT6|nr:acetyl-CoA carboxylase carboxyltransferase subunit alpha [Spirochaeta thermophila]ADN01808.1 acetyl-coenzyme A carboxylase carboxyl transferase subunit alpha [Spirochaeta thermophila DSM 6192]